MPLFARLVRPGRMPPKYRLIIEENDFKYSLEFISLTIGVNRSKNYEIFREIILLKSQEYDYFSLLIQFVIQDE
jgi:hypothetical protein